MSLTMPAAGRAWARARVRTLAAVLLCCGTDARADALPPPKPLKCEVGQTTVTDHSGTHCEQKLCASDVTCPAGTACVARSETRCDPRGQPCSTSMVSRCAKSDKPLPPPRCPPGAQADPKRTQAVLTRLRTRPTGKDLLAAPERALVICYGDVAEGVLEGDVAMVLQRDRPVPANAARLGHLLHHLIHGLPFNETIVREGGQDCGEVVANANGCEQSAHQLESELRQAFDLPPLPFQDLADQYRQRCRELRPKPAAKSAK
jgi:hypothetical protein